MESEKGFNLNKINYDNVVIGANFAGVGAAFALEGKTLVIEKASHAFYDFVQCFDYGKNYNCNLSDVAKDIKEELLNRNVLSKDGFIHLPALLPVMYNRLGKSEIDVLLLTDVLNIVKTNKGYEIEFFNVSGTGRALANRVVDAKGLSFLHKPEGIKPIKKSLNALLYGGESKPVLKSDSCEIMTGNLKKEYAVKFNVNVNDDLITARAKLHDFWKTRPESVKDWKLAAVADYFEIKNNQSFNVFDKSYMFLPSYIYDNALIAFDEGYNSVKNGGFENAVL